VVAVPVDCGVAVDAETARTHHLAHHLGLLVHAGHPRVEVVVPLLLEVRAVRAQLGARVRVGGDQDVPVGVVHVVPIAAAVETGAVSAAVVMSIRLVTKSSSSTSWVSSSSSMMRARSATC